MKQVGWSKPEDIGMEKICKNGPTFVDKRIEEFLAHLAEKRYSPKTIQIYRLSLRNFAAHLAQQGVAEVSAISTETIEKYRLRLLDRGFKMISVDLYLRALRRFFGFLASWQWVFANPMDGVELPRVERTLMPVPTEEQIRTLLAEPDVSRPKGIRDRAVLETMYSTAIRIDETSRLRVQDADLANGTLRVRGKGDRERVVPLGRTAQEWLQRYLTEVRSRWARDAEVEALWLKAAGTPFEKPGLNVMIKNRAWRAGIEPVITPHGIRRACATHMLQHGANPVEIQMLLGHASLDLLGQYLRLSISDIRAMHARSKLGQ